MRKIKNGLILAGGDSSRFWPLEEKNFFSFLGKPLIFHQVEELSQYCEKITVIANKTNATAINRYLENSDLNAKYQVIIQKDMPGQAGAVSSAKNLVKGETLIVNTNDLVNYSILTKLTSLAPQKNKIVFFGKKINEYFPGGYFKLDGKNKVREIIEKPPKDKTPSSIVKLVIDYYSDFDLLIREIESIKSHEDNHYELAINRLLSSVVDRDYFLYDDYWQSLKYPWHVLSMMKLFLTKIKENQISPSVEISKKAVIVGPVIIGDNARIGEFVKITGPAFIGKSSIIGDYSLVRESQIGEDCLIGSYTEVARSYISNKVYLHRNYAGDSVLSDGVMMGAQAVTSNLRFDGSTINSYIGDDLIDTNSNKLGMIIGRRSKIGVNATIFPGVKIGKDSWIGPGEVVRYDVGDKIYLSYGEEKDNLKS